MIFVLTKSVMKYVQSIGTLPLEWGKHSYENMWKNASSPFCCWLISALPEVSAASRKASAKWRRRGLHSWLFVRSEIMTTLVFCSLPIKPNFTYRQRKDEPIPSD